MMIKFASVLLVSALLFACNGEKKKDGSASTGKSNNTFKISIGNEPSRLNPVGSTDGAASKVASYVYESLLSRDINTYEWKSALATEWKISDDKMKYTFKLRKGVKFHDGVEFTAKDVKFSYDVIFMDKFKTVAVRPYYEGIKEVKIIDDYTVEVIAKDKYWQNFDTAAGMSIYPKHFYEQDKKKSFFNKNLNGTGPYKMDKYERGKRIILSKNKAWWGDTLPEQKEWKFDEILLRFETDSNMELEKLKNGSLDFVGMQPDDYVKKAVGKEWGKSVHKVLTQNKTPKGYSFIGWNMKHPILKDRKVRKALYHLVNRNLMIEKFEHNYSVPAKGPIYPESPYHDSSIKAVEFNPTLALELLKEAGWKDTDGDNILDKVIDGKKTKLSITILEPWDGFKKYLTVYKEDAKKAGVEINIEIKEWNSFIKLLDERKFEACRLAWSAALDWNPIQIWHTNSYNGGSNFIGFSNKEADELMTKAKFIHNRAERIKVLRKVEKLIIDEYPYVWMSYKKNTFYGHTDRVQKEQDTLNYGVGSSYWTLKSNMSAK